MLDVLVRNAHGNLDDKQRDYAAKKIGRLDRYFHAASKAEIAHTEERLGHCVEVTLYIDGLVLHGHASGQTPYVAIDAVVDKLEGRVKRLKSKLARRHRSRGEQVPYGLDEGEVERTAIDNFDHVVENRHYSAKPVSLEEAVLRLEMGGQPFFLYVDDRSKRVSAVYKRTKGGIGLMTPEV